MQTSLDASGVLSAAVAEPKEMLSVTEQDGKTLVRINYSSLALLQKCARKAEYSLIRGLKPNLESPALLFGLAIHKGLEVYYSGERTERRIPDNYHSTMQMIACGQWEPDWAESLLFRAARAFVEKAQPLSELPDENDRSVSSGVYMLTHYFQKYATDEYVVLRDSYGPVVERKFTLPLFDTPSLKVDLFGQIDFVMRSDVTGQILPGDHKTAGNLYGFYDKIKPNFQYVCYSLATREVLGLDTNLFLVNALQVKKPPKTARGTPPDFARQVTECTEQDYEELRLAVYDTVTRFLDYRNTGKFPMAASGACTANYGSCEFMPVCAAPLNLRESIITAKYTGGSYAKSP